MRAATLPAVAAAAAAAVCLAALPSLADGTTRDLQYRDGGRIELNYAQTRCARQFAVAKKCSDKGDYTERMGCYKECRKIASTLLPTTTNCNEFSTESTTVIKSEVGAIIEPTKTSPEEAGEKKEEAADVAADEAGEKKEEASDVAADAKEEAKEAAPDSDTATTIISSVEPEPETGGTEDAGGAAESVPPASETDPAATKEQADEQTETPEAGPEEEIPTDEVTEDNDAGAEEVGSNTPVPAQDEEPQVYFEDEECVCDIEIDGVNDAVWTGEEEVNWWKHCSKQAEVDAGYANNLNQADAPNLLEQFSSDDAIGTGGRRLGKRRSGRCRRTCNRRRRLTNNNGQGNGNGPDLGLCPDEEYNLSMEQCLQEGCDVKGYQSFCGITDYELTNCVPLEESEAAGEERVNIDEEGAKNRRDICYSRLVGSPWYLDGEKAMAYYDKCFCDMYNCYYKTIGNRMIKNTITDQFLGSKTRRNLQTAAQGQEEESVLTIESIKETCRDTSNSNTPLFGEEPCPNDYDKRRQLGITISDTQCPRYDVNTQEVEEWVDQEDESESESKSKSRLRRRERHRNLNNAGIPPLEKWIEDCLKATGDDFLFPPTLKVHTVCHGPTMTQQEFDDEMKLIDKQFKEKEDAQQQLYDTEMAHEKHQHKAVMEEIEKEYYHKQMTRCGKLTKRICDKSHWPTMLRVMDVDSKAEKVKASYCPTPCRQMGDVGLPIPGRENDKLRVHVRKPTETIGIDFTEHRIITKTDTCDRDIDFGDCECNSEFKSLVQFFVEKNPVNGEEEEDDRRLSSVDERTVQETIEKLQNDFDNDLPMDMCYFEYEVDCACQAENARP